MTTLGQRVEELRALAKRRGVADEVDDLPDPWEAIRAYADVLGLDVLLATNLNMTLKDIKGFSPS